MLRRLLWVLGALVWGGVTFLVGLYVTFPASAVRERVEWEVAERSRNEWALSIADLSLWRLSGVSLDDVTLYSVKKGRRTKDEPDPPKVRTPTLHLDSLSVRAAPLGLLMGKQAAAFVAETLGGAIDGSYAQSDTQVELAFDADDIDLGRQPIEGEEMKLALRGILSGEADLVFDTENVKQSTGSLKIAFDGLGLDSSSAVGGFNLPEVTFTKANVEFECKDGKLEVTQGDFEGDTLNATLSGDIVLNKKLARSRNRLELAFSLPEDLDKLAQIAPDLKRARDDEGKYHVNIGGTVFSPSVRFSRSSARKSLGSSEDGERKRPNLRDGALGGDFDPSASDEDRRKAREERIKERRERLRKRREEADRDNPKMRDEVEGDMGPSEDFDQGPEDGPMDPREGPLRNNSNDGPRDMQPRFPPDGGDPMDGPQDGPPDGPMGPDGDVPPDFGE